MRLTADADPRLWVSLNDASGFRERRQRRLAIRATLSHGMGTQKAAGKVGLWLVGQVAPLALRHAGDRMLLWAWRDDPELLVAGAVMQELTPQLRVARASMPMEYDDTESFRSPHLGMGEKLVIDLPADAGQPPSAIYFWETSTHLIELNALCFDRARFGLTFAALDELARSIRIDEAMQAGESNTLRIDEK